MAMHDLPLTVDNKRVTSRIDVKRGTILLVEDRTELLELMRKSLELAGYAVSPSTSGDQAKDIFLDSGPYDLLITDIWLPGVLQGARLAADLRELHSDLQIVFVSGYVGHAFDGLSTLADVPLLTKPVSRSQLLTAVEDALSRN